jgi:hypothetical protein
MSNDLFDRHHQDFHERTLYIPGFEILCGCGAIFQNVDARQVLDSWREHYMGARIERLEGLILVAIDSPNRRASE